MRHAEIGAMYQHPLRAMDVPGLNPSGQGHDFLLHLFAIILDRPVHSTSNVAYLVPSANTNVSRSGSGCRLLVMSEVAQELRKQQPVSTKSMAQQSHAPDAQKAARG